MNGIAALAVKEVAVVSGFGSGLLAPSAVDGFAVGTLLSAVCLLMAIGPRRRLRRLRQARQVPTTPSSQYRVSATCVSAASAGDSASAAGAAGSASAAGSAGSRSDHSASVIPNPLANESAKVSAPAETSDAQAHDSKNNGYRSKHRLSDPDARRRPESRRSAPRHAARVHGIGRTASKLPLHPVPVRD